MSDLKCVIVVRDDLPLGLAVNAASVLALTLGRDVDGLIGPDLKDRSGEVHRGITTTPLPILKASGDRLREIRLQTTAELSDDLHVVDFTDAAQTTRTYDDYAAKLAVGELQEFAYLALGLYGSKKLVNRWVGSLALLR